MIEVIFPQLNPAGIVIIYKVNCFYCVSTNFYARNKICSYLLCYKNILFREEQLPNKGSPTENL